MSLIFSLKWITFLFVEYIAAHKLPPGIESTIISPFVSVPPLVPLAWSNTSLGVATHHTLSNIMFLPWIIENGYFYNLRLHCGIS